MTGLKKHTVFHFYPRTFSREVASIKKERGVDRGGVEWGGGGRGRGREEDELKKK